MRTHNALLLGLAFVATACAAPQATAPAAAAPPPPAARAAGAPPRPEGARADTAGLPTGDIHDFDFFVGEWSYKNRRLKARGVGSDDWDEFMATGRTRQYLGGMMNVNEMHFPSKGWSGLTVRVFNPETKQWSIYWINSRRGVVDPSQVGGFTGDRGEFYGEDEDDGRRVKVRYLWLKTGPDTARWEQAFSYDGRSWETNWTSDLVRKSR